MRLLYFSTWRSDYGNDNFICGLANVLGKENVYISPDKGHLKTGHKEKWFKNVNTVYPLDLPTATTEELIKMSNDGFFDYIIFAIENNELLGRRIDANEFLSGCNDNLKFIGVDFSCDKAYYFSQIDKYNKKFYARFKDEFFDANEKEIIPLSFCLPKEKMRQIPKDKKYDVNMIMKNAHSKTRQAVAKQLVSVKNEFKVGHIGEIKNHDETRDMMTDSYLSVNVEGAGYDTLRYWEIVAYGSLLLTQKPQIVIPNNFVPGVDCYVFDNESDFLDKLRFALKDKNRIIKMTEYAQHRMLKYHTAEKRAEYFLDKLENKNE